VDLVPFAQCASLGGSDSKLSDACRLVYWPVSDVPERHLGFPVEPIGPKGRSLLDRLAGSVTAAVVIHSPNFYDWIAIHGLLGHHGEPLLMRLGTGVPVPALWLASRATSSTMVNHRSMNSFGSTPLLLSEGNWVNCEGRLVMQFARHFLYF